MHLNLAKQSQPMSYAGYPSIPSITSMSSTRLWRITNQTQTGLTWP